VNLWPCYNENKDSGAALDKGWKNLATNLVRVAATLMVGGGKGKGGLWACFAIEPSRLRPFLRQRVNIHYSTPLKRIV
jgi:hypothetical protein